MKTEECRLGVPVITSYWAYTYNPIDRKRVEGFIYSIRKGYEYKTEHRVEYSKSILKD